jgi:hypothetical protein
MIFIKHAAFGRLLDSTPTTENISRFLAASMELIHRLPTPTALKAETGVRQRPASRYGRDKEM